MQRKRAKPRKVDHAKAYRDAVLAADAANVRYTKAKRELDDAHKAVHEANSNVSRAQTALLFSVAPRNPDPLIW